MTDDQRQEFIEFIASKCSEMQLEQRDVIEGISYSLISALREFDIKTVDLNVIGYALNVSKKVS